MAWADLSDGELIARLLLRQCPEGLASRLVQHRDEDETADTITYLLGSE